MKAAVAFLVIFLAFAVGGASHNRKHKAKHTKHEHEQEVPDVSASEGDYDWPQPEGVKHFDVPDSFTHTGSSSDSNAGAFTPTEPARQHHGKLNHKKMTTHHY